MYVTTTQNYSNVCSSHDFLLIYVLVILMPYCCLFRVLSNDMLTVSIGTFSLKILAPTSWSLQKKTAHKNTLMVPISPTQCRGGGIMLLQKLLQLLAVLTYSLPL